MSRFTLYVIGSVFVTVGMVANVYSIHKQYYPTMVHFTRSNVCMTVLGNVAFLSIYLFGDFIRRLFLGQLLPAESESVKERLKHSLMETFFAMTIFRQEFNMRFVCFYSLLVLIKVFHWLAEKRVYYVEQTPNLSALFHWRIVSLMATLFISDVAILYGTWQSMMEKGPSILLLFCFEAAILTILVTVTFFKYTLHTAGQQMEGQWPNKGLYIFYLDLASDFCRLVFYTTFFVIIMKYYGLPLHMIREVMNTFRSFRIRAMEFLRYRQVTYNMEQRFPAATREELEALADNICVVCREEMTEARHLPCNHYFHLHCLRSWLERQPQCPTCRFNLLDPPNHNVPRPNRAPAQANNAPANNDNGNNEGNAGAARNAAGGAEPPRPANGDDARRAPPPPPPVHAPGAAQAGSPVVGTPNFPAPSPGFPAVLPAFPASPTQQQHASGETEGSAGAGIPFAGMPFAMGAPPMGAPPMFFPPVMGFPPVMAPPSMNPKGGPGPAVADIQRMQLAAMMQQMQQLVQMQQHMVTLQEQLIRMQELATGATPGQASSGPAPTSAATAAGDGTPESKASPPPMDLSGLRSQSSFEDDEPKTPQEAVARRWRALSEEMEKKATSGESDIPLSSGASIMAKDKAEESGGS